MSEEHPTSTLERLDGYLAHAWHHGIILPKQPEMPAKQVVVDSAPPVIIEFHRGVAQGYNVVVNAHGSDAMQARGRGTLGATGEGMKRILKKVWIPYRGWRLVWVEVAA